MSNDTTTEPRYVVVGYAGTSQKPRPAKTLKEARVLRDLCTGRIVDMKTGEEVR